MTTKIITVEATPPAESTGADYYKGAPLNAAEFDQNLVNLRAAVDRKASLNNPTFTGTVTLPSTTSIGDVSATELQYLNSVTSNVQDQINSKAPINNPTFTGTVSLPGGTANGVLYLNGSKQVTSGSGLVFDSSGNLGIGTSSPTSASGYTFITLQDSGSNNGAIFESKSSSVISRMYSSGANSIGICGTFSNHPYVFCTNSNEKMRLDSSGNLLVGTTSAIGSGKVCVVGTDSISTKGVFSSNAGSWHMYRSDSGVKAWQIHGDGDSLYIADGDFSNYAYLSQNPTAWQWGSDRRIKTDIVDLDYGLSTVLSMRPRRYKFISSGKIDIGFIAQEIQTIVPEAVTGEEITFDDADTPQERANKTMGVGKETLIPILVKAIQEQQAIIESLTQRIEALEYKGE